MLILDQFELGRQSPSLQLPIIKVRLPLNVQHFLRIYESVYSTRQECNFIRKYARTSLKSMCMSVKGVTLLNALDISLISCRSVNRFKKYYTDKALISYVLSYSPFLVEN